MDKKDIKIVKDFKNRVSKKVSIKKMILFGSRANGNAHKWSDFDIIIVSDKFKGKVSYKRCPEFYDYWKENYPVDFLCYTPTEFDRLKRKITIVKKAVEEGVEI